MLKITWFSCFSYPRGFSRIPSSWQTLPRPSVVGWCGLWWPSSSLPSRHQRELWWVEHRGRIPPPWRMSWSSIEVRMFSICRWSPHQQMKPRRLFLDHHCLQLSERQCEMSRREFFRCKTTTSSDISWSPPCFWSHKRRAEASALVPGLAKPSFSAYLRRGRRQHFHRRLRELRLKLRSATQALPLEHMTQECAEPHEQWGLAPQHYHLAT